MSYSHVVEMSYDVSREIGKFYLKKDDHFHELMSS